MQTRKWVLLVEDESEIREIIRDNLEEKFSDDIQFVEAKDGLDATRRLPFQAFDLILTDLRMPKKEGIPFISSVRTSQLNQTTPIIVITGSPDPSIKDGKDYIYQLPKPIDFESLYELVETQFKLGKTDKRMDANFINQFIVDIKKEAEKRIGTAVEMQKPCPKVGGQELAGHFFKSFTIGAKKSSIKVVLSFENSLMEFFKKKLGKDVASEKLADQLGHSMTHEAITQLATQHPIKIMDSQFHNVAGANKEFQRLSGIEVGLQSHQGLIHLYTFWKA
jgi:CheY-like chemotaxis protein